MDGMKSGTLNTSGRRLRLTAIALSSVAAIGLVAGSGVLHQGRAANSATAASGSATHAWPGYADLVEQVLPSVVSITARRSMGDEQAAADLPEGMERWFRDYEGPGADDLERFMERFFGPEGPPMPGPHQFGPRGPQMAPQAAGSGFIIDAEGLVVTNNHVVEGASEITVVLNDGTEVLAEIVGTDPDTDLALLRIDTDQELQAVTFADSDQVRVGDPVVAIGNPFNLGGTVTAGIVSAKGRAIGSGRYDDFLQIDAPINRGNSGGPTFDLEGEVVGVNTAIFGPSGGNVGIGFAIPANLALRIIDDLEDDGAVERGWLGVQIQGVDEDLAYGLGLDEARGALVAEVMPETPAAGSGIERGDVILTFDGAPIETLRDLTSVVADTNPGSTSEVVVWRNGEEVTLEVDIGKMPPREQLAAAEPQQTPADKGEQARLGVLLAELTPAIREQMGLGEAATGVVVTEVMPGSPAAEKGVQPGDVIIEADRTEVAKPADIASAVEAVAERGDDTILLLIQRDGDNRFVAVPIAEA
jgi:serine protease Do